MDFSIIIPFRPSDKWRERNFEWCVSRWEAWYPDADIQVIDTDPDEDFNRPYARNFGARVAEHDILVFADADTFACRKMNVDYALTNVENSSWILPYEIYYNANEEWSNQILSEIDPREELPGEPYDWSYDHKLTDSISGIFITTKKNWETISGEDERFHGWGYEDRARELALDTLCGPHFRTLGYVVHLWHPAPEESCFGQPHITENRQLYERYLLAKGDKGSMRRLCDEHK